LQQRAGTPGHEAKMAYIGAFFQDKAKLDQFVKTYQPSQWKAAALMMYDIYQPPAAPVAPRDPQPLRPGAVRPGAAVAGGPVTAESAVRDAFAMIGR
jgi:hypothetical protein